jgi:Glycosyl transferases group 1
VLGVPLEGLACGATAVVTPARDQPEVIEHDVSGLVAEHDDVRGAAGHLDRLARDRELLARLREGARSAAAARPDWDAAAAELHAALEALVAEPPPDEIRWPVRLMADAIAGSAVLKQELAVVGEELHRVRADDAYRIAQRVRGKWERVDGPAKPLADRLVARARARLLR